MPLAQQRGASSAPFRALAALHVLATAVYAAHYHAGGRPWRDADVPEEEPAPVALTRGPRSTRFPDAALELEYVPKIHCERGGALGSVTSIDQTGPSEIFVRAGEAQVHIQFVAEGIVRVQMAPTGDFQDFTGNYFLQDLSQVEPDFQGGGGPKFQRLGKQFRFSSGSVTVYGQYEPLRLSLYRVGDPAPLWEEAAPMEWNATSTRQTLHGSIGERFYGCGMQNGFLDHSGRVVPIQIGGGWDEGGRANPAPFYMSSKGYGVLRNTFSPGTYSFQDRTSLSHDDLGLDSFFFVGSDMREVLQLYTSVVGRPFMPPIWGLWLGDSDCYNNERHGFDTLTALDVAKNYTKHNMPRGWMMVNDGYGCSYTSRASLRAAQQGLQNEGIQMGLWTSTGLGNATWEIGRGGSRAIKTDVAWVGTGYKFGLHATKQAAHLMTENSDSRPFTWTVCAWTGTQKYAVIWTGDNEGSWEYIRMQIPTVLGSGMSGFAHASGDVDGIFGGSPETYVRDLQWKTFITAAMTMSGWAPHDKQPWAFGEPYTTYNRRSLTLRARLTPYLYSLSWEAHQTGLPPARAMVLEFPEENWPDWVANESLLHYQFMSGPSFLVAPVYRNESFRDGIALPSGEWIDFNSRERYTGPQVVDGYEAPLHVLPVFVRAGAIVPMWPDMQYVGQRAPDPLVLDLYPKAAAEGDDGASNFTLHEDDGVSRRHEVGGYSQQLFTLRALVAPLNGTDGTNRTSRLQQGSIVVHIGASVGHYKGKPDKRRYLLHVHATGPIQWATVDGNAMVEVDSFEALRYAAAPAWAQETEAKGVLVRLKTGSKPVDQEITVELG